MLHPNLVPRGALALALVALGCASNRPVDALEPVGPARAVEPTEVAEVADAVDVDDLFARLNLELLAAWREGAAIVLDIQEERDETALEVLAGFDCEIVGDAVYLTPRYAGGTSGRRQRFRTRFSGDELPENWRERVYLAVGDDLKPLPFGAEPSGPTLRQHIELGARVLR